MPTLSPRRRASASSSSVVMSTPSSRIRPVVGASSPAISPRSVDLPLPDAPVIATARPRAMSSDNEWRIVRGPAPLGTVRETSTSWMMRSAGGIQSVVNEAAQSGEQPLRDDTGALSVRMDAVFLIQRRIAGYALEQERNEDDRILIIARQPQAGVAKSLLVVLAEI